MKIDKNKFETELEKYREYLNDKFEAVRWCEQFEYLCTIGDYIDGYLYYCDVSINDGELPMYFQDWVDECEFQAEHPGEEENDLFKEELDLYFAALNEDNWEWEI